MKLIHSKTCFMEKLFQVVAISNVCLNKLNYLYYFLTSWEKAATRSYARYTSLRMFPVEYIYIFIYICILNFKKAHISCATRIFWKIVKPKSRASNTFRCMIRNIATCSFPAVEKLLEATKSLSSNVSPQIINSGVFLKSTRK